MKIAEANKNGSVTLAENGLERILKRAFGKDDRQFIPYKSISFVSHDRRKIGRDVVTLQVGGRQFVWKVIADAEGFVDEVNMKIAGQ